MNEESLFAAVLEKSDPAERRAFLDAACGDDRRLRDRIEQLLAADESPRPVFDRVPTPTDLLAARPPDTLPLTEAPTHSPDGSPSAPDVPGYAVLTEIARGGMGVVYRARQFGLNRDIALKMLLGPGTAGGAVRFLAEAEAVAAIDHPHVIRVFEFGRHRGDPFLAMEYLSGGTLADRLKGGPAPAFTPADGAALVQKLAAGVGAAHDLGIVHRDLKPGNVLFDDRGEPKVADFGLAKRGGGADLTRTGVLMGTPAYMAPEQASGNARQAGPAADVWALGVILYECLTGRRPFDGSDPWAVLGAVVLADPPAPRSANPVIPRDLDLVCRKCLAKEPRDRYLTAGALADDLGRFLAGQTVMARPAGLPERAYKWARRRPAVAGLLAAVLALLAASLPAVTLLWLRAEGALGEADDAKRDALAAEKAAVREQNDAVAAKGEADRARVRAQDLLLRQYAASAARGLDEGDPVAALVWSVEGLKESGGDPAREREHRVRLANGLRRCWTLVGAWPVISHLDPAFTADGGAVLLTQDHVPRLVEVSTGRVRIDLAWKLTPAARGWNDRGNPNPLINSAELSPDGRFLVSYNSQFGSAAWDARTGDRLAADWGRATGGSFDPTGLQVAVRTWNRGLVVRDLPSGRVRAAVPPGLSQTVSYVVFDPTGDRIIMRTIGGPNGRDVIRAWDLIAGRAIGADHLFAGGGVIPFEPQAMRGSVVFDPQGKWGAVAFDPDGAPLFAGASSKAEVRVRNLATGAEQVLTPPAEAGPRPAPFVVVLFSPDRTRILASSYGGLVCVWDLATGQPTCPPLGRDGPLNSRLVRFAPDGRRVAAPGEDGTVSVWELPAGRRAVQVRHPGRVQDLRFSPDGGFLITAGDDGTARVWNAHTGAAVGWPMTHCGPVERAGFAPDGRRVWAVCRDPASSAVLGCVWDAPADDSPRPVGRGMMFGEALRIAEFASGDLLVNADATSVRATEVRTGRVVRPLLPLDRSTAWTPPGRPWPTSRVAWNADLTRAAVVVNWNDRAAYSAASRVELWNWEVGRKLAVLVNEPKGVIRAVEFAPGGGRLLTLYEGVGGEVRLDLWNAATGTLVANLTAPPTDSDLRAQAARRSGVARAEGAFFSPDGATVYATGWRRAAGRPELLAWDAAAGRLARRSASDDGAVAAVSPDGRLLLTVSRYGNADWSAVWDLPAGAAAPLWSLAGKVTAARFGPGGRLVTAAQSRAGTTVRVWDAASGRPLTPAVPQPNPIWQVGFDPTGGRVVVVSAAPRTKSATRTEVSVQVLDAATGRSLTPRMPAPDEVFDVRFTPDGQSVEAALANGQVVRWNCSPSDESPALLALLAAVQSGRELDPSGTPVQLPLGRLTEAVAALRAVRGPTGSRR